MEQRIGGIVLCGGHSQRMGRPKAWLPFGDELMLPRVVRIVSEVVSPIVVVAARDQELPLLPPSVQIVRDEHDNCGPLAGLAAGLGALAQQCDAAYATSCDVPLLLGAFIQRLTDLLETNDAVIPREVGFHHPLAAVYRTHLGAKALGLIQEGQRKLLKLVDNSRCRFVEVAELRDVDPDLRSLRNLNSPADYEQALAENRS